MIVITPQTARTVHIQKGRILKIIDLEGGQVADFWAFASDEPEEVFSAGVTIDKNESFHVGVGDILYSNRYKPLFRIVEDTVGVHDLIHPCCRQEMYDDIYQVRGHHPSCLSNINEQLEILGLSGRDEIRPFNIFMHTEIKPDGSTIVKKPLSKPGDYLVLQPLQDQITVIIAACSVDLGNCNTGRCTSIGMEVL